MTDTGTDVGFDPEKKPGVSNLLSILAAATGRRPEDLAGDYTQYGPLKADTADAVIELLRPVRERYEELAADPRGRAGHASAWRGEGRGRAGRHPGPGPGGSRVAVPHLTGTRILWP